MTREIDYALRLAGSVLDRLGPGAPDWRLLDAHYYQGQLPREEPPTTEEVESPKNILIRFTLDSKIEGAYFTVVIPHERATVAAAEQIQDHALESAHGAALPPCPGHQHPLQPREVEGVACWVCPNDLSHHQERIMSDGR